MKLSVLVIGLGRFGSSAARELMTLGHDVLAIDRTEERVNDLAPDVTRAIQADATDMETMRHLGATDFQHAIVAISGDPQPSIFATMALKELGVANVVAKAGTTLHGRILERVGADRVVYPERDVGRRVAHSFAIPNVLDYLDVAPGFGIVKLIPPPEFVGRTLRELDAGTDLALTPIALRRGKTVTINPALDERIGKGDELILIGRDERLERLVR